MWIVEVKEEGGEAQHDVLLRRRTEGRTQQLHACHRDEESPAAAERHGDRKDIRDMLTYAGVDFQSVIQDMPKKQKT